MVTVSKTNEPRAFDVGKLHCTNRCGDWALYFELYLELVRR